MNSHNVRRKPFYPRRCRIEWKRFEGLNKTQTEISMRMSMNIQKLVSNPEALAPIIACLMDWAIAPGDFEKVSAHLLKVVTWLPECQELVVLQGPSEGDRRVLPGARPGNRTGFR